MNSPLDGYTLLDSGDGRKLERFGDKIVSRPSSLSAWRQRGERELWGTADATFYPPDRWEHSKDAFTTWTFSTMGVKLELELMSNGQLGIFPEHALYLPRLGSAIRVLKERLKRPLRVLNLFAYTGLATCFCAKEPDVVVTHVDLSKKAIEWAKRNTELNSISSSHLRWIVDDALAFMAREHRKSNVYDIVIIDPPSFSRVSKNNTWTLEEKVSDIVRLFLDVLNPEAGFVFFTNHSTASTVDIARNIALDFFSDENVETEIESLALPENTSKRLLPAGSLIVLAHGVK